jgi:hypothetical protein
MNKNVFFNNAVSKNYKESLQLHHFCYRMSPAYLFRAALYNVIFVLHIDVLFHWHNMRRGE